MLSFPFKLPVWAHIVAAVAVFAGFQGIKGLLDASYAASGFPVDYATGQLSFSAEKVMGYYAHMQSLGTLPIYWRTQFIDFGFMAMVAAVALMLGTLVARMAGAGTWGYWAGLWAARLGIAGALMDACENLASFVMLANPADVPQGVALVYSSFAAAKFALMTAGMAGVALAFALGVIALLRRALA